MSASVSTPFAQTLPSIRQHSSRMHTAGLETVCVRVSFATTNCEGGGGNHHQMSLAGGGYHHHMSLAEGGFPRGWGVSVPEGGE